VGLFGLFTGTKAVGKCSPYSPLNPVESCAAGELGSVGWGGLSRARGNGRIGHIASRTRGISIAQRVRTWLTVDISKCSP